MAPTARVRVTDDGMVRFSIGRIATEMEPNEAYRFAVWFEFGVALCYPEAFLSDPEDGVLITSSDIAQEIFEKPFPVRQGPPNVPEPRDIAFKAYMDQNDRSNSEFHLAVVSKTKKTETSRLDIDSALELISDLYRACAEATTPEIPETEEAAA